MENNGHITSLGEKPENNDPTFDFLFISKVKLIAHTIFIVGLNYVQYHSTNLSPKLRCCCYFHSQHCRLRGFQCSGTQKATRIMATPRSVFATYTWSLRLIAKVSRNIETENNEKQSLFNILSHPSTLEDKNQAPPPHRISGPR